NLNHRAVSHAVCVVSVRKQTLPLSLPAHLMRIARDIVRSNRRVVVRFQLDSHPLEIERIRLFPELSRTEAIVRNGVPGTSSRKVRRPARDSSSARKAKNVLMAQLGIHIWIGRVPPPRPDVFASLRIDDVGDVSRTQ